jgi:hypothetical protein
MSLLSTVASAAPVAAAAAEDIRDIHGPLAIASWWRWPLVAAVTLLALTALAFAVRAWRARKLSTLSPLDRARQALAKAEQHAREGRSRDWADLVAETTRGALAAKLGAQVLPQTTPELTLAFEEPAAGAATLAAGDVSELIELLGTCDLARFARAHLDTGALLVSTETARALIERMYAPAVKSAPPRLSLSAQQVTP